VKAKELLVLLLITGVAVGAGWWLTLPSAEGPVKQAAAARPDSTAMIERLKADAGTDPQVLAALESLQRELVEQRREQAELRRALDELRGGVYTLGAADPELAADPDEDARPEAGSGPGRGRDRGMATRDQLLAAGFNAYEAEEILATADRVNMQRLELQYQARREGWTRTGQFADAVRELPNLRDVLTESYGSDAYDRYLYASGMPNRVVVDDVFRESPAAAVGLRPGDRVIALAGERVYSQRDLGRIATDGSAGELIPAVVERDGARFEVYMPRGPLGIRAGRAYEPPPAR